MPSSLAPRSLGEALDDGALGQLAARAPLLTALRLGNCERLSAAGVCGSLRALRSLAELDLAGCSGVDPGELRELLPGVTCALVHMPDGSRSPTGSPLRLASAPGEPAAPGVVHA